MSEFKIKVRPEPYRTRAGEKVFIVQNNGQPRFCFVGSDGSSRTAHGMIWNRSTDHPQDIIFVCLEPPAPVALPDRMEVWLRFAAEIVSTAIPRGGFMDFPIDDCAKFAGKLADAMTAEYERRKGGGK